MKDICVGCGTLRELEELNDESSLGSITTLKEILVIYNSLPDSKNIFVKFKLTH